VCVFVEIEVPDYPRSQAGRLRNEAAQLGLLEISAQRQPKAERGSRFLLGPSDHPCACGLGADRVDETGEVLGFDQAHCGRIESLLSFLVGRAGPSGVHVCAYFQGGAHDRISPRRESNTSLEELVEIIRRNRLGGNVRYHVRGEAA
jgi:hypothetical protein